MQPARDCFVKRYIINNMGCYSLMARTDYPLSFLRMNGVVHIIEITIINHKRFFANNFTSKSYCRTTIWNDLNTFTKRNYYIVCRLRRPSRYWFIRIPSWIDRIGSRSVFIKINIVAFNLSFFIKGNYINRSVWPKAAFGCCNLPWRKSLRFFSNTDRRKRAKAPRITTCYRIINRLVLISN